MQEYEQENRNDHGDGDVEKAVKDELCQDVEDRQPGQQGSMPSLILQPAPQT